MDDDYFDSEFFKRPRTGAPRSPRDQVDRVLHILRNSPEPGGVPDDGISSSAAPQAAPAPAAGPYPQPRHWSEVAENILAQSQREDAERAASANTAAAPPPPAVPSPPNIASTAYDWARREAYLQANKIADDVAKYYRNLATDPVDFAYRAGPSFGPFGAEAGAAISALGRIGPALGRFGQGERLPRTDVSQPPGGLNLYKWNDPTSTRPTGWREGDRFLYVPDQGSPKLNWQQNASQLRQEMQPRNPIHDTYRDYASGELKPATGFLNAERELLKNREWRYDPQSGSWFAVDR